nr:hypothetical protein [Sphingomonas sp. GV3]
MFRSFLLHVNAHLGKNPTAQKFFSLGRVQPAGRADLAGGLRLARSSWISQLSASASWRRAAPADAGANASAGDCAPVFAAHQPEGESIMRVVLCGAAALAAALAPAPAVGQKSFPSAATGVRVGGSVALTCNASGVACQPASATSPLATRPTGGTAIATAQTSVGTTATLIAAARTGRQKVTISVGAANACVVGAAGVTAATGFALQPVAGASVTVDSAADVYAACSATTTISVLEQY